MKPMVGRGSIKGRVLVIRIQSKVVAVVVRPTLEGVQKAEGEKCH
jgi:hypothetical protein